MNNPEEKQSEWQNEIQLANVLRVPLNDLVLCERDLYALLVASSKSSLRAVRNKFLSAKYISIHSLIKKEDWSL